MKPLGNKELLEATLAQCVIMQSQGDSKEYGLDIYPPVIELKYPTNIMGAGIHRILRLNGVTGDCNFGSANDPVRVEGEEADKLLQFRIDHPLIKALQKVNEIDLGKGSWAEKG